jgi:hypothetical protein
MSRTTLAVALTASLLLTACGSDEPAGAPDTGNAGAEQTTPSPEPEPLTQAELQSALVTLDDLPTGYSPDEVSEDDDGTEFESENPECQERYDLLEDFGDEADVEAKVAFAQEPATSIEHSWGAYSTSEEELSEQLAAIESVVTQCAQGRILSTDGTPALEVTFTSISFPQLGDDSFAMNGKVSADGITVALTFAFVRVGQNVQAVFQGGLGPSDPELVAKVAQLGVERLPKK